MRVCGDYRLHLTQNLSVGELPKITSCGLYTADTTSYAFAMSLDFTRQEVNYTNWSFGSDEWHNNISASIAVYIWRRIS